MKEGRKVKRNKLNKKKRRKEERMAEIKSSKYKRKQEMKKKKTKRENLNLSKSFRKCGGKSKQANKANSDENGARNEKKRVVEKKKNK